jgi:hypothetical protein
VEILIAVIHDKLRSTITTTSVWRRTANWILCPRDALASRASGAVPRETGFRGRHRSCSIPGGYACRRGSSVPDCLTSAEVKGIFRNPPSSHNLLSEKVKDKIEEDGEDD